MKLNSSTITTGDDYYKNIKLKSLKPLFMPNIRTHILFQRTINMYNYHNLPKNRNLFDGSIIVSYLKSIKAFNRSCNLPKKNYKKRKSVVYKINSNKYKISRTKSENDINVLNLNESSSKNNTENKDKLPIKYFNLISGSNGYKIPRRSVCMDFNIKSKSLLNLKNFRLSNTKYWLNDFNNNNYKDIINSREMRMLNKNEKKELQVKYYKWFI